MSPKKTEAEKNRPQNAALTKHYRAIGPAAVAAALICMARKGAPLKPVKA